VKAFPAPEVTELLNQWAAGNQAAGDVLMPLLYTHLRQIARRYLKRQRGTPTLQTTAVVHEAYIRLTGDTRRRWENRTHFFGVAAKAMRHVLIDYARAAATDRRGGENERLALDEGCALSHERLKELVRLDDALVVLSKLHPRQSQVVELRFFGGWSVQETAEALNISPETVARDWRAAKAWLYRELED
jgi:RNA polymerase sigma-70 factor, ECF subfamily